MRQLSKFRQALCAVLLGIVALTPGWAQEADTSDEENSEVEPQVETAASDDYASEESVIEDYASAEPASEEIDVDDGSYIDAEEEDFRPSEEINKDHSIPFPTDI